MAKQLLFDIDICSNSLEEGYSIVDELYTVRNLQ